MKGIVTKVFSRRGYFFIETAAGFSYFAPAGRCFSKFTDMKVGVTVIFDVNEDSDRPQATNIALLEDLEKSA